MIGRGLEYREIAVVGIGQLLLEALQVLGHGVDLAHDVEHLLAALVEELLGPRPGSEVEHAERERDRGFFAVVYGVVVGLVRAFFADRFIADLGQLAQHLGVAVHDRNPGAARSHLVDAKDIEDQNGMVRDHCAAALGDDVGVRLARFVAGILDRSHDVVGVLLHRVDR